MEISTRELDGVLYFALHLAKRGVSTFLGDYMVNRTLEEIGQPVAYVEGDQSLAMNSRILSDGGVVLNLNPEGLGFADDPPEVLENYVNVGKAASHICTWGQRQSEIIRDYLPEEQHHLLTVTGYHSFDLVNPDFVPYYRNETLVKEFGTDLILMNTSFATSNHKMGFGNYVKMLRRMDEWKVYNNPEFISFLEKQYAYQTSIINSFIELARTLAEKYPDRSVVIRPHPAENRATYAGPLNDLGNVTVTTTGSVREWLAMAGTVIHHDCTTGLEGFLMGRNVIQYRPIFEEEFAAALLSAVGVEARSIDEVIAQMDVGTMETAMIATQLDALRPYLANIDTKASAILADMVVDQACHLGDWKPERLDWWGQAKCWRKYMSKLLRAHQPGHNGRKVRYALDKFPRTPLNEIQRRLEGLRQVDTTLPPVTVSELTLNTFLIGPV
ncbi:hypothetical protein OAN24_01070 [Pseudodesulfovibrio sp.]|nr:hypothetical protein [Pseudodesulfovibrio sp.]